MATIQDVLATGIQQHQAGQLQAAEQSYRQILAIEPNQPDAWHLLGVLAHQVGKHDVAIDSIGRAIRIHSTFSPFHISMGNVYQAMSKSAEAAGCYRRAVELTPNNADAYYLLGNALMSQRMFEDAVKSFRRAVELNPNYAEAHNNLGAVLKEQGKLNEAIACYRRVVELRPNDVPPHHNLGVALKDQGELEEAVACCRRAVELNPNDDEALSTLGNVLADLGKLDEAIAWHRRAVRVRPESAEAHKSLGLALLLAGEWQQGWPEYEWRWQTKDFKPRGFAQPQWIGEPLACKTILLHAEQGLGDTIQFIRFASLVKERGGTVIVECQRPLLRLLDGLHGIDQLIAQGDRLPAFDLHVPLLSVPGILKTTVDSIPATVPYLFAKSELQEQWRERLSTFDGFKIGINWQGRTENLRDRFRSIPLRCFESLARIPEVRLISLQKGEGIEQLADIRSLFSVTEFAGELDRQSGPFMDTAAVMKNLDLVITSDTAAGHLAGALGVPVWLGLSFTADWRWLLNRSDTPWYPTMRLFRQKRLGDWSTVFEEIEKKLREQLAKCG